ncbi:hypothetical protein LSCM1_00235 [Leishmania martiniquensis]|uniref:Uncharacterized protein n=1 Tax=Leishmania martiniquensis TaxID=1580590 RepID=A0A836GF34_9TRYP|nr:hypothetical protein LSCM1_00235 [Leishmania martiniquensis]
MTEEKVVKDLAEVCASGAEAYSAWTTAKAVVQRRYLSVKSQGTFEGCAELLAGLARVLRTHLRVDLAQEFLRHVLFGALEHFSAKAIAGATAARASDGGVSGSPFLQAAADFLQRVFSLLVSATTRTYTLTGPLPLAVEWNRDANNGGVDAAAAQSKDVVPWAEDVVLEFVVRAAAFLSERIQSADILSRWAHNLFVSYEQLLALRLSSLPSQPSTLHASISTSSTAPSSSLPVPTLAAQLLRMSIFSSASRKGEGCSCTTDAAPTPVAAAVYWLTHLARQPSAVNHLFAQYVYFDILCRSSKRISASSAAQGCKIGPETLLHERVNAALVERCTLSCRGAILMARTAVEVYRQAFPLALQKITSTSSRQRSSGAEDIEEEGTTVGSELAHFYGWTWFLDSLTLALAHGGGQGNGGRATAGDDCDAKAQQRQRQQDVCKQLLNTYAAVAAEIPALKWGEVVAAYTSA